MNFITTWFVATPCQSRDSQSARCNRSHHLSECEDRESCSIYGKDIFAKVSLRLELFNIRV